MEREKLLEFVSAEGQQELFNYCNRPRRTMLEVLHDFYKSAAQVPVEYLFDLIPAIKPRAFSIASSAKVMH
jgi:sulfite reductase alpha subunit-like flavoprotein